MAKENLFQQYNDGSIYTNPSMWNATSTEGSTMDGRTKGKLLSLQTTDMNLISRIMYGSLSTSSITLTTAGCIPPQKKKKEKIILRLS